MLPAQWQADAANPTGNQRLPGSVNLNRPLQNQNSEAHPC